jgi:hypothetical protein
VATSEAIAAAAEALFARVEPPPMTTQRWLDEWLPAGGRASAASERPAPRDDSAPVVPDVPALPALESLPGTTEPQTPLTPEEISDRYDEIDAWLEEHQGDDEVVAAPLPDMVASVFGNAFDVGGSRDTVWNRLAGVASLGGHAMRGLEGLREGFSKIV